MARLAVKREGRGRLNARASVCVRARVYATSPRKTRPIEARTRNEKSFRELAMRSTPPRAPRDASLNVRPAGSENYARGDERERSLSRAVIYRLFAADPRRR